MASKAFLTIGELIRKHRKAKGYTQLELGQKLGYTSPQFVSLFERGFSKVPVEVLGQLVVILGLPEQQILTLLIDEHSESLKKEVFAGKRLQRAK